MNSHVGCSTSLYCTKPCFYILNFTLLGGMATFNDHIEIINRGECQVEQICIGIALKTKMALLLVLKLILKIPYEI